MTSPVLFKALLVAVAICAGAARVSAQQPNLFSCSFASIDTNGWVSTNILAVTAVILLAAIMYAMSNFIPSYDRREVSFAAYQSTRSSRPYSASSYL